MGDEKRSRKLVELDDLLYRLSAIEKRTPQSNQGVRQNANAKGRTDRFLEIKSEFLVGMGLVKTSLKEVKENKSLSRTRDQIARTQQIRTKLKELSKQFSEMEVLLKKEVQKRKSKLGAEELKIRSDFLTQFKRELEGLKKLSLKSFSMGNDSHTALTDVDLEAGGSGLNTAAFINSLPQNNSNGTGAGASSPPAAALTKAQEQSLQQIQARDKEFDDILDQIGLAVDQASEKAKMMQDEAQLQNQMLDKVEENLDRNFDKMQNLNVRMKKDLEDKGMGMERFCINCVCLVVLLGVVGAVVQVAT